MKHYLFALLCCFAITSIGAQARIHPELEEAWLLNEQVELLIIMEEQPDASLAQQLRTKTAKGSFVFQLARRLAERTQTEVRDYLEVTDIQHRPYYIVNAFWGRLTHAQAIQVADMTGVARLDPNPWIRQDLGWEAAAAARPRSSVEWGVERVGATELWANGNRGAGAVVGGQDTGYEWYHPAIVNQYRGTQPDTTLHDYNWHDAIRTFNPMNNGENNPCGLDSPVPCDDNNHGTHTMGTMVGDDGAGNQIGVAPEASWIGCRNMERGYGSPASYIECFEFFLAPTRVDGSEPDPTKAPHVIANSWSCPEVEGCLPENFGLMEIAINNLRASGVVVVTSAGNQGSNCYTVNRPPSFFAGAFAVGATAINDSIAGFSSRGPSTYDSTLLQPQIVAPGVGVRSCVRDTMYRTFQGTSMAGPHVAGAVALLIAEMPELAGQVDLIEQVFRNSALPRYSSQDCGPFPGNASPNAVYGHGLINLPAALIEAQLLLSNRELASADEKVEVFPNPSSGAVLVRWPQTDFDLTTAELLNLQGQQLSVPQLFFAEGLNLDLSALPTGLYLLRMQTSEGVLTKQIILQ